jgi:mannose-6-phosphate isomerase
MLFANEVCMTPYPLRFEPLFKSMLWGGRRLPDLLRRPAPSADPIGEAWVLSDVDGSLSVVADGPLAGRTLRQVIAADPAGVFGRRVPPDGRFPLLLKFLDAKMELSVQVHPNDEQAVRLKGPDFRGKTEAWVILDADPATSVMYAGLRAGVTADRFRAAMAAGAAPEALHAFTPKAGDCVFLEAGTVHAIGADTLLFEVQQTSDITYRLYDWGRVDAKTGRPRDLHVEAGLACTDFARGPVHPVTPEAEGGRERLVGCRYFSLHRTTTDRRFTVGRAGECRVVVVLDADGRSEIEWDEDVNAITTGDVLLLPAAVGECSILPAGRVTVLECGLCSST